MASDTEHRVLRGVNFLRLRGTLAERSRAHGLLLRDAVVSGALPALAAKNETIIRRGPGALESSALLRESIVWVYKNLFMRLLERSADSRYLDMLRAMGEATGLPYEVCRDGLFQPDALMLLTRTTMMQYVLGKVPETATALPGCTSAVVSGAWTKSGRMLACRNQDYPVVGVWEPNTAVLFNEPTEPGHLPHVSVSTAGVHTAGLTSMNSEGLTLFLHAHFGRRVSLNGRPIVAIGDEIVSRARTLSEAIDIARRNRRCGNWAFVVSSAKEKDAVVIEMDSTRTCVRPTDEGFIGHSNFFHTERLSRVEALLSGGCRDDLVARFCRIRDVMASKRGALEPSDMAAALGDHVDPMTGEERVYGNTVGVVTTVKSVVFEPETQRMWISTRGESPQALESEFVEIQADRFWKEKQEPDGKARTIPGYRPRHPELTEAVRLYREAYRAWHMSKDDWRSAGLRALEFIRQAIQAYPRDGHLWAQAGFLAFKLGKFHEALNCLRGARDRILAEHVRHVCNLYYARCLDLMGDRRNALRIYRNHSQVKELRLKRAFKAGLRRKYRAEETARMVLDLQFPDTFDY